EFSASRLFFLAPFFFLILSLGFFEATKKRTTSLFAYIAIFVFVVSNLVSAYNFSRRQDALQSTYIIPWAKIAEDVGKMSDEDSILLYDDDTLPYWLPPDLRIKDKINLNTISDNINEIIRDADRILVVFSPRDITSNGTLDETLRSLESDYILEKEITYLKEDETSVRYKSIVLGRPVEPIKKAMRIYRAAR
ncbi:MAG: hypothetical protein ABIC40_08370, partial [bacterium]